MFYVMFCFACFAAIIFEIKFLLRNTFELFRPNVNISYQDVHILLQTATTSLHTFLMELSFRCILKKMHLISAVDSFLISLKKSSGTYTEAIISGTSAVIYLLFSSKTNLLLKNDQTGVWTDFLVSMWPSNC